MDTPSRDRQREPSAVIPKSDVDHPRMESRAKLDNPHDLAHPAKALAKS